MEAENKVPEENKTGDSQMANEEAVPVTPSSLEDAVPVTPEQ
jgi:hypothetical protein